MTNEKRTQEAAPVTGKALLLRTCEPDLSAHDDFKWPESGPVECPDWEPTKECGNGLHGLLPGQNDPGVWREEGRWLVVEAEASEIIDLGGKCKFPRCEVVHCGDRVSAMAFLAGRGVPGPWYRGTATAGNGGTATAGNGGAATAGEGGAATAGEGGAATAGEGGAAAAGAFGTATAGDRGTAAAGEGGELRVRWHDGRRFRLTVGYVGEDGIEPGCAYGLDERGRLAKKSAAVTSL